MHRRVFSWAGLFFLLCWVVWWAISLARGELIGAEKTSIHIPAFGVDFWRNTETPVRIWLAGDNPYADKELLFAYPPIVSRVFAWVYFFTPKQALTIWVCCLSLIAAWAAYAAAQWRGQAGLGPLPKTLAMAIVLFSTPVLFAIERGNYDLLVIPFLIGGVALTERESGEGVIVGGLLIAVAIWLKLYPAPLILGLLVARRYKAVFWTLIGIGLIGMFDVAELAQFHLNTEIHVARAKYVSGLGGFAPCAWNHSLTLSWPAIWKLLPVGQLNGVVGGLAVIGGLIAWVSWAFWQRPVSGVLLRAYLLWIVSAATFLPPVSNDYNLAPLILVLLVVWQGRHWFNWVTLIALVVWAQPIGTSISGAGMLFAKLIGLTGTAWLLIQAIRQPSPQSEPSVVAP